MWLCPKQTTVQECKRVESKLEVDYLKLTNAESAAILEGSKESPSDNLPTQEAAFDPEKTYCCTVENGCTLVHGAGGRGYGLGSMAISSGCYQWKVKLGDVLYA